MRSLSWGTCVLLVALCAGAAYVGCADNETIPYPGPEELAPLGQAQGPAGAGLPPSKAPLDPPEGCAQVPPSSAQKSCNPGLMCASGYNIFLATDYVGGVDVGGSIGVGGKLKMSSFSVGHHDPGGTVVVAEGDVWLEHGTVHGTVLYGGGASVAESVGFREGGSAEAAVGLDLGACLNDICTASIDSWLQPATADVILEPAGDRVIITLRGAEACMNVFRIDADDLSRAALLMVDVPEGSSVVLNVDGGPLTFTNYAIDHGGNSHQNFVVNAPEAERIDMFGFGFEGSLLACNADVFFDNGQQRGTLVARSLTGNGEYHHWPFRGCLP